MPRPANADAFHGNCFVTLPRRQIKIIQLPFGRVLFGRSWRWSKRVTVAGLANRWASPYVRDPKPHVQAGLVIDRREESLKFFEEDWGLSMCQSTDLARRIKGIEGLPHSHLVYNLPQVEEALLFARVP